MISFDPNGSTGLMQLHQSFMQTDQIAATHGFQSRSCGTRLEQDRSVCAAALSDSYSCQSGRPKHRPARNTSKSLPTSNKSTTIKHTPTMKSNSTVYVGIDVSKYHLDVYMAGQPKPIQTRFSNQPRGLKLLCKLLARRPGARVVCESTGPYHMRLVAALQQHGLESSLVNPKRVRDFARAQGYLAKTDRIDAKLLAEFGQKCQPRQTCLAAAAYQQLQELSSRRAELLQMRIAEQNRLERFNTEPVRRSIIAHIRWLDKQLQQLQVQIERLVSSEPELEGKVRQLMQIKGVGLISAACVLAHMPELGSLNRGQAAALAGVAPYSRDSGTKQARRYVSGGRVAVRRALYMCALVCARHNPALSGFYQRLRARGKPPKVALVALMRKLIVLMNNTLKTPKSPPI